MPFNEENLGTAIVVPGGTLQLPLILLLREKGYIPFVLDGDKDAPAFAETSGYVVDINNHKECWTLVSKLDDVRLVVSNCSDAGQHLSAYLANRLGLPAVSVECSGLTRDKFLMKKALVNGGIQTAKFNLIDSSAALLNIEWDKPKVVKPTIGSGSNAVQYLDKKASLSKYCFDFDKNSYLIEDFITGNEIAIDGFVIDGNVHTLAISEKFRSELPFMLDIKLYIRAYSQNQDQELHELAKNVAVAMRMDNCAFHIEVIKSSSGYYVVECASRGAGFHVFNTIIPRVTGIDTLATLLNLAINEPFLVKNQEQVSSVALLEFPEFDTGKVLTINRPKELGEDQSLVLLFDIGDRLSPVISGATRHSYAIIFSETTVGCDLQLANLVQEIVVTTER